MDVFTGTDLEDIVSTQAELCISMYLPTRRRGGEIQQNPIRFKNLLQKAAERLARDYGLAPADVDELLAPARALVDDMAFWRHQSDGLAAFLTPDDFRTYELPVAFDDLVVVGRRFHVKPLLQLLSGDGRFYVLALSQNDVRLLQGTRFTVDAVDAADLPASFQEALALDEPERHLQLHTGDRAGTGAGGIFHGHGVVNEEAEKERIRQYFRMIDAGVGEFLAGSSAPLVLAGVAYLHPIYAEVNSYPHLVEEGVTGNPDEWSAAELHERAWPLVADRFARARRSAEESYRQLKHAGNTATGVEAIVPAAHYGRVDTLFVALGTRRWGRFDPETGELTRDDNQRGGSGDLLDLAAVQTLANGGTVYAVPVDAMPDEAALAAVLRY